MVETPTKSLAEIHSYWSTAAKVEKDAEGLQPSARDPYLQEAVEAAVEPWLRPEATLLDIGCGEGTSTLRFARSVRRAVGIDYIPDYVCRANENARRSRAANVEFASGNVMALKDVVQRFGLFDVAVTIRCLINLESWKNQAQAIAQVASCIKPGGLFLTSEGWEEGMTGLNLRRSRAGLAPIRVVEYNRMITRSSFEAEARNYFDVIGYANLGYYLFQSRVFQPLFVAPERPSHTHPINAAAARVQSSLLGDAAFADCDYAGVYVLRRKANG